MSIPPIQQSEVFFGYRPIYVIPKYQRGYAWDKLEIEDFVKDLDKCFQKRVSGTSQNHFFGGIVSVKKPVQGAVNQHSYELVDGQQSMATFTLLVGAMIKIYNGLLQNAILTGDQVNKGIIENRIQDLKQRFIEFQQEINRVTNIQEHGRHGDRPRGAYRRKQKKPLGLRII